jgi:regulator of replication initiation timing
MTEKRFQYNVNKNCIEYDGKFVAYLNSVDGCRIANYWNGLYKENEQLRHDATILIQSNQDYRRENEQLKQSYKEFEDECQSTFNAMSRKQNDLYRKNFKLKEENEKLRTKNNAYIQDIEVFKEENTHLKLENEQLKHKLQQQEMEYATDLHRLAEENEQLKYHLDRTEKELQEYKDFMSLGG